MATGDLIKLGTFYLGGTKRARPTRPWDVNLTPPGAPGPGNIPTYSIGSIEIRDTDSDDAYKIQWREVNDNGKRLLISDRVLLWGITWDNLNSQDLVFGKNITIDGQQYILRLLTGGTSRRGSDGYAGGSPTSNDWDRIIVNEAGFSGLPVPTSSDLDSIQNESDFNSVHNQFWNWFYAHTWGQDATATGRVIRGYNSARYYDGSVKSSQAFGGWRPVLEALNASPSLKLTSPPENLLGADGNCEDTSKWTKSSVYISLTLDSNNKKYGNYSIRYSISGYGSKATGGFWSRDLLSLVDKNQYYVALVDVKNGNADSAFCKVSFRADGSVYRDGNKLTDSTKFNTSYLKISPTDLATANALTVWGVVTADEGEYAYFDGFRIYQVSQDIFNKIGVDPEYTGEKLAQKFPFTDPTTFLALTEGNTYVIAGTATDTNNGNVVTVKYKIDDGTVYNITASVSNGTTPINFSKTLTYLNNRLYDGSNPVTPILAENVTHTLTVWAEDDQGGRSANTTRNFSVLYNQPPQISGSDQDLGTITTPPSIQYTVSDVEGYSFTITEAVDGNTIRSFPGTNGKQETLTIPHDMWIKLQPGVTHQLTITATDQYNASSKRTFTFKRAVAGIELATTAILPADAQPTRVILSLNGTIPDGSNLNVQVCNNAHDVSPTWEDMSQSVKNGRPYVFTNTTSTSGQWGIRFKISILPGG